MAPTADRFTPVRPLGPYMLLVQDQDGAPMVLKRLSDERAGDAEARHDFRLEAWRVAQLRGPRLVRLYADGSQLDERPFYTMGYAEGPPATLVQPAEVASCARQLLEALVSLHRHGWVHAGLEPSHLRRTEAGLVLVGYGSLTPMGQPARRPGTVGYRSPEQEAGLPLDARADLYGVGALIHFWLTGELPGELDLLDLVSDPLAALGRRLLARAPGDRIPDAATALAELDRQRGAPFKVQPKACVLVPPQQPRVVAMDAVDRLLGALGRGAGGVHRLEAPPGWGKTTVLSLAAAAAGRAGYPVVRLRGLGLYAWPLAPWRDALRGLTQLAQERHPGLLERCRLRLAPLMAPPPGTGPEEEGRASLDGPLGGELLRRRLGSALTELLGAVAPQGLVVLVDDWDEADEASREMLAQVVRRLAAAPVLWLVAGQPGRTGEPGWPTLDVPPFSQAEALELARAMLPAPPAREAELQTLAAAAAGQPWFVRTLLALWRDAGEIRINGALCDLPPPPEWPETVGALAWRRGSALDGHAWAVGGAAALLAPIIRPAALEALVPELETFATGLDALLRAGILTRAGGSYQFTHPDYATMYARALPPERQLTLQRTLVEALQSGRLALDPLTAALHALRAERPDVAVPQALTAARRVLLLGGHETARQVLEEALVMLDAEHPLRGSYLATLGEAYRQAGDLQAALTCLREARGRLPSGPERPASNLALARVLATLSLHEEAVGAWQEAAGHAQAMGDMDLLALALAGLTESQHALGRLEAASESGEAAIGAAAEAAQLPRALALTAFGAVLALGPRERQGEGVALLQQACALFETEGDRPRLGQSLLSLADAEMARGEVLFARTTITRALAVAEELAEPAMSIQASVQAAQVMFALGETEAARDHAKEARHRAEARQDVAATLEAQTLEGLIRAVRGDKEAGLALGSEALRRLPSTATPAVVARIWLWQAEALLHLGMFPEAAHALHVAAAAVKASNRVDLEGRRTYLLGVWAARTGDRERARQELRAVLAQPNQLLVAQAALRLGQIAIDAGARSEAAGWLEQGRRTALALGAEKLAIEVERVERTLQGLHAEDDDAPPALAARLETLLTEARALLPRVTAPAEELARLSQALREARALNALWPRLFGASEPAAVGAALASCCFELVPGATRAFVLDQALEPYVAVARGAGTIPFSPELVDAELCAQAMGEREVRALGTQAIAVPLAEGPTAPVWGVVVLLGEAMDPGDGLLTASAAGAMVLARLEE
ncbi:MAG: AAA family ATPase [Candidatus Sericytochromatia bacterium]|nr:AAA family ATPase [Candidatus Sericytochromatia bacterium]